MQANDKKRILIAPLNWGLGHATRCIPIIRELKKADVDVLIAAEGRSLALLQKEFPELLFLDLPGSDVSYSESGTMILQMIRQLPHLFLKTIREHRTLNNLINDYAIDGVISDSRFGLFSQQIPCVYITHQIQILAPVVAGFAEPLLSAIHRWIIHRFSECWIPDVELAPGLSGKLSHWTRLPRNARYIGPLTRFHRQQECRKRILLAVVLSGPEPQRTIFEKRIREQLPQISDPVVLVLGKSEEPDSIETTGTATIISSLNSEDLQQTLMSAQIILSRPGYSTIMDLAALGAKAIFVPTPGQTEQEYLANHLMIDRIAYSESQDEFSLVRALQKVEAYIGFNPADKTQTTMTEALHNFLSRI
jgi:uncharacterized protein (TIGR00661 family)